eukprot:6193409-Pleurochrysis_carterae.AAC.5
MHLAQLAVPEHACGSYVAFAAAVLTSRAPKGPSGKEARVVRREVEARYYAPLAVAAARQAERASNDTFQQYARASQAGCWKERARPKASSEAVHTANVQKVDGTQSLDMPASVSTVILHLPS